MNIEALSKGKLDNLKALYTKAKKSVPWKETFALYDEKEYLASAVNIFYLFKFVLNTFSTMIFKILMFKVDVYYNASKPKYFTLDELKKHDSSLVKFIDELIPCNYEYLNRCNSNRGLLISFCFLRNIIKDVLLTKTKLYRN